MAADFAGYLDQLDQLEKILKELTELSQKQRVAVLRGELTAVDETMKRQQALSLSLRGLEQKREKALRELGLAGTTLSQLPGKAPAEHALRAKQTVERVLRQFEVYRSAQTVERTTLECSLHTIEAHMPPQGGPERPGGGLADIRA